MADFHVGQDLDYAVKSYLKWHLARKRALTPVCKSEIEGDKMDDMAN